MSGGNPKWSAILWSGLRDWLTGAQSRGRRRRARTAGPSSAGEFLELRQMLTVSTAAAPVFGTAPQIFNPLPTSIYLEGQRNPQRIFPLAYIVDIDSPQFDGGRLTVALGANAAAEDQLLLRNEGQGWFQVGVQGDQVFYGGELIGTLQGGAPGDPLVIEFQGAGATTHAVQAVLRNLQFRNASDDPAASTRAVSVRLTDPSGMTSPAAQTQVQVVPLDAAPVIGGVGGTAQYLIDAAQPVFLAPQATVGDPDDATWPAGRVAASLGVTARPGDVLSIIAGGTGANAVDVQGNVVSVGGSRVGTFSGGTDGFPLIVQFDGAASPAAAQAILRRIAYTSTSNSPSTDPRLVTFFAGDGAGHFDIARQGLAVVRTNHAPEITHVGPPVTFQQNATPPATPVRLAPAAQLADDDSTRFNGGVLTVAITGGRGAGDVLSILPQGTGAGQINVDQNWVGIGGELIGYFTGGTGSAPLEVHLVAYATRESVEALIQRIAFSTSNSTAGPRTISIQVTDGDGGTSAAVTQTVEVETLPAPPSLSGVPLVVVAAANPSVPPAVLPGIVVAAPSSADLQGGTLAINLKMGAAGDLLRVQSGGGLTVQGDVLLLNGVALATLSGGTGTTPLSIHFTSAAATAEIVQQVAGQVTFANPSVATNGGFRMLHVQLRDGAGRTSDELVRGLVLLPSFGQ